MENPFVKLFAIDFKDHLEVKKSGNTELKYVSWAYAWAEVKKLYPAASYEVKKFNGLPYVYDPITGFMVYTTVTIEGVSHEMWLPVLDGANKAMKAVPYTYTTPKWDYNPQTRRREKIGMEKRTVEAASILDFGIPVFEHAYATSVENGPLFPNGKGGFWNEKNWRNRKFYPFLEEIGIQPNPYDENGKRKPEFAGKLATYTPYTTRHTYASLCDRAGVNKDILKRAVGHTPKSKTLDEVYLHPKANQMIEAFDSANQLVKDEVLALPEE